MAPGKLKCLVVATILMSMSPLTVSFAQSGNSATQGQATQPDWPQVMPGMMMHGTAHGMVGGMSMGPMRGHMMKIMFAVADTDGDGALSFEEVVAVHKRIFDSVDANNDGKVTLEEMQTFMQGQ